METDILVLVDGEMCSYAFNYTWFHISKWKSHIKMRGRYLCHTKKPEGVVPASQKSHEM